MLQVTSREELMSVLTQDQIWPDAEKVLIQQHEVMRVCCI